MQKLRLLLSVVACLCLSGAIVVHGEDPYRFFDWDVRYGTISPLGVRQRGILINGQFPGPTIVSVTNDNLMINVHNNLDVPFLFSWNGIMQRKDSWQDGVYGTNCPIPPGKKFTYHLRVKDQIGSYFYFPSLDFHKAAGGYGALRIYSRPRIPVPFNEPTGDYSILIGDWYNADHKKLQSTLDGGHKLGSPDGVIINGRSSNGAKFNVQPGKTYRLRISNVGLQNSLNFRIQGHKMKLVEVEGTHTQQNVYTSLDIHVGQSYSVLVTANQPPKDYFIVVSTRFTATVKQTTTGILHYTNSRKGASGPLPGAPTDITWSINQARSIRTNLTASGPRPNPQGSYHYGIDPPTRTIRLASSAGQVKGKQRYAVNGVSFIPANTPLKLADHFKIPGVFRLGSIPNQPKPGAIRLDTSVMAADHREKFEVIFENSEDVVQTWHVDGYAMFVVGMDRGKWSPAARKEYNLRDTVARYTVQVYPRSWTAVYVPLDNVGMWNVRTQFWARRYLGQQFYLRVYSQAESTRDQYLIPENTILCGRAVGRKISK